jgi:tRNA pseudouridine synthase 10
MEGFDFAALRESMLASNACDRCVGRQFAKLFPGKDDAKIGAAVRAAGSQKAVEKLLEKPEALEAKLAADCALCAGLFLKIDEKASKAVELLRNVDFESYLTGVRVDQALLAREEELWARVGAFHAEPLKKDLVRQIGLRIGALTGKHADFKKPDVNVLVDFVKDKVFVEANPLFVYGKYRKLVGGIPQTKWYCRECRGRGCARCSFTGKMYPESVEEIIAVKVLEETGGKGEAFHGSGREDIEATLVGWRPFVLEIERPVKRRLGFASLEAAINKFAGGKVEVSGLRPSSKDEVRFIKAVRHDKSYVLDVECEQPVSDEQLQAVARRFDNVEVLQKTPTRVMHRRSDLVRKRLVKSVRCERVDATHIKVFIVAEAGTYAKELVHGDAGRTAPSVAEFFGPCKVLHLTVLEIIGQEGLSVA